MPEQVNGASKMLWTLTRVVGALAVTMWAVLHLRAFDHYFKLELPYFARIPGILIAGAGGGLVLWCGGLLSDVGIFEETGDRTFPKEFVAQGPFRYLRNPMSLGGTLVFFGVGLYLRSISILLFSIALFVVFHMVAVYYEEPGLAKRFGESYMEYKRSVGRWIPRMRG